MEYELGMGLLICFLILVGLLVSVAVEYIVERWF